MPNRILKESLLVSDTVDNFSAEEERFFTRLILNCDDFGLMDARLAVLRARLFPLKTDSIRLSDVCAWLMATVREQAVLLYVVGGRPYLKMVNFEKHQPPRAKKPKYPLPSDGAIVDVHPEAPDCGNVHLHADASKCEQTQTNGTYSYSYSYPVLEVANATSSSATADESAVPEPAEKTPETPKPKKARTAPQQEQDAMITAIAEEFDHAQPLNKPLLRALSAVAKALRDSGMGPSDVAILCEEVRRFLPKDAKFTAMALPRYVDLWRRRGREPPEARRLTGEEIEAQQAREAEAYRRELQARKEAMRNGSATGSDATGGSRNGKVVAWAEHGLPVDGRDKRDSAQAGGFLP